MAKKKYTYDPSNTRGGPDEPDERLLVQVRHEDEV